MFSIGLHLKGVCLCFQKKCHEFASDKGVSLGSPVGELSPQVTEGFQKPLSPRKLGDFP